jgi:hypothetical protein
MVMKFEGGWITSSYKRPCSQKEGPEGYHLFHYKDKDTVTKSFGNMFDFQERNVGAGGSNAGGGTSGRS